MGSWLIVLLALCALWRWWLIERQLRALIASQAAREKLAWVAQGARLRQP